MTIAANPDYTDVIQTIGQMLFQALWEQEPDLEKKVRELDNIVNQLLRKIGLLVESLLLTKLASVVTQKAKAAGLTIHRSKRIKYLSFYHYLAQLKYHLPTCGIKTQKLGRVQ